MRDVCDRGSLVSYASLEKEREREGEGGREGGLMRYKSNQVTSS